MTIALFQTNEVIQLYNRISKLKPSMILGKEEQQEPQDVVKISAEAKKKQILEQARSEVLERIRKPR
jgi:hypothetical protein